MRSLLSINSYHYLRGGSETVYFGHAEMFAMQGWASSFFSMHHEENIPCADSKYFVENIDYKHTQGRSLSNAFKIIYSVEARQKLSRLLDEKRIDFAHIHSVYHHLSPSVFLELKERGIPMAMTAHDLKIGCPNNKMLTHDGICERCKGGKVWNVAMNRCIKGSFVASSLIVLESAIHKMLGLYTKNIDRLVAPSKFYRDKLIEWGFNPNWIVHIPNAIEVPQGPIASPGDYILYFGRLSHEKGLVTLVKAAARAKVPVKIVGTGPLEAELKALAAQLSSPVEFLGFLSGAPLWSVVNEARATVLPSEWYENGPMSAIEALGRGKPLIGANIAGIPELIPEGRNGWLFESGDVTDLAGALEAAYAYTPSQIRSMGEAAREYVQKTHSSTRYYDAMSTLYADLGVK